MSLAVRAGLALRNHVNNSVRVRTLSSIQSRVNSQSSKINTNTQSSRKLTAILAGSLVGTGLATFALTHFFPDQKWVKGE